MFRNVCWITFLCLVVFANAQEPVSIHFTEKDGLPDKEFYDILEDKNGFIWMAADKGLFRYDGKDFKSYTNSHQRGLSVFNLKQDSEGRVWCNNISGQFFYIENDQLNVFMDLSDLLKGELADYVIHNDKLVVFALRKMFEVSIPTKSIKPIIELNHTLGSPFKLDNRIYFNNSNKIEYLDVNGTIKQVLDKKQPLVDANGVTISQKKPRIFKVNELMFLFDYRSDQNKFYQFDPYKDTFREINGLHTIKDEIILSIFEHNNEIWFGTYSGVWVYEYLKGDFILKRTFLNDYNITEILKDSDEIYWFTTKNNGVFAVPSIHVENHSVLESEKNITSLEKINDSLLVFGTANGNIGFHNPSTQENSYLNVPSTYRVSSIKYLPQNNQLLISKDINSYAFNLKTNKLVKNVAVSLQNVKSFTHINNDLLYTTGSMASVLKNGNIEEKGQVISTNKRTYASHFQNKTHQTYIAYVDNIYVFDKHWNSRIVTLDNEPIFGKSFTETEDGVVWVGTFKNGLIGIKDDQVIQHFKSSNGLTSNKINKIKANGHLLWIVLDNSIQLFNIKTKTFKTLTKNDGIPTYDITGIEILNNKIYCSSNIGLFSLDNQKVFKDYDPEVYFTEVEVNEVKTKLKNTYKLAYNQNAIKIGFNVNGLYFNEKGIYQYRLKGFKDEWSITDSRSNFVAYNSLPAGSYSFQVKPIIHNENNTSNKVKELKIAIRKRLWEQWWFIGCCILLMFSVIVIYYRRKINKQEKEKASQIEKINLEKEVIASNLKALRSQMNPHFIFNSLNSIQDLVLKEDTEASYDYIVLFANLIRNTLNYSNKDFIPLEKELEFLKVYLELEKLRFGDDFEYEITCTVDDKIAVPSLLIQPFIENALVHGLLHKSGQKHLSISFQFTDVLQCIVIDNGIGRKKAKEIAERQGNTHESFALKAIKERLNVYQKIQNKELGFAIEDLYDDTIAIGTKTIINLPFKHAF